MPPLRRCKLRAVTAADTLPAQQDASWILQTHILVSNFSRVRSTRRTARRPCSESEIGIRHNPGLTKS